MPSSSQTARFGLKDIGLVVLAACTAWLVIQNTLLFLAMMSGDAAVVWRVTSTVVKAAALVTASFWASPAAAALVAAVLVVLVIRFRPTSSTRSEAHHG
jgi:membrane protein implicated in regulation of membrane protease activity